MAEIGRWWNEPVSTERVEIDLPPGWELWYTAERHVDYSPITDTYHTREKGYFFLRQLSSGIDYRLELGREQEMIRKYCGLARE